MNLGHMLLLLFIFVLFALVTVFVVFPFWFQLFWFFLVTLISTLTKITPPENAIFLVYLMSKSHARCAFNFHSVIYSMTFYRVFFLTSPRIYIFNMCYATLMICYCLFIMQNKLFDEFQHDTIGLVDFGTTVMGNICWRKSLR